MQQLLNVEVRAQMTPLAVRPMNGQHTAHNGFKTTPLPVTAAQNEQSAPPATRVLVVGCGDCGQLGLGEDVLDRATLVAPALNAQDGPHTGLYHIDSANNMLFMFCSPGHGGPQHAQAGRASRAKELT